MTIKAQTDSALTYDLLRNLIVHARQREEDDVLVHAEMLVLAHEFEQQGAPCPGYVELRARARRLLERDSRW